MLILDTSTNHNACQLDLRSRSRYRSRSSLDIDLDLDLDLGSRSSQKAIQFDRIFISCVAHFPVSKLDQKLDLDIEA